MKNKSSLVDFQFFSRTTKNWNVSDGSLDIPVPHQEMEHAKLPISSEVILKML